MVYTATSSSQMMLKPLIAGAITVAVDKFYYNNDDLMQSLIFGAAVAASQVLAVFATPTVMAIVQIQNTSMFDGKTLEQRIIELGCGVGTSFVLNRYILKNDPYFYYQRKIGTILAADIGATYLSEFLSGEKLAYI